MFGIGFFSPIFSHIGIIWKDVEMGIAFALSLEFLAWTILKQQRVWVAFVPLFYGFAIRHNAPPPGISILLVASGALGHFYLPRQFRQGIKKEFIALGLTILIFIGFKGVESLYTKA